MSGNTNSTDINAYRLSRREMESIGSALSNPQRNIRFDGGDLLTKKGYTLVPNHVLASSKISPGAKMVYILLLKYAWQADQCFPEQQTVAKEMGAGLRTVQRFVKELEDAGFVSIKRQGLGRPNVYVLHVRVDKHKSA